MDKKLTWLKQLSETCGVSGFETPIKNLLQKRLQGKAKVSYDKLGSAVFTNEGQGRDLPKIMLASHMDEIGFMVKHIYLFRWLVGAGYAEPARYCTRQQG